MRITRRHSVLAVERTHEKPPQVRREIGQLTAAMRQLRIEHADLSRTLERQQILARPAPPLLWYVLHEGLLRHVIGDQEIMGEQIDKLIKAAETPGIVLQVLPFTANDHAGIEGPITIFERSGGPAVAYTECYGGGRLIEGQDEVAHLTVVMGMLHVAALPPRESLHLMRGIRRDLDG